METLPPEVMVKVAQYLPVEDLTSCCAVSPWWREVFGSDELWRPWCDADYEEYLRTTPCRVEPKFTSPESENSTLSPIGQWRTAYMREKHLRKNWIHGNCIKDEFTNSCGKVAFLNNDFVIIVNQDFIRLIDTTVEPPVCVAKCLSVLLPLVNINCEVSVVRSDTFIIWDKNQNIVQVIGVDWESYVMSVKHSFGVSEGNRISDYIVVNTLFVGYGGNLLHIWDLDKATKLKTESCLDGSEVLRVGEETVSFESFCHDEKCEKVGVVGYQRLSVANTRFSFYIYNVKELRFLPFSKHSSTRINASAIVGHYAALADDGRFEVYNYQTSQLLQTIETNRIDSILCAVGNCFMFCNKNDELVKLSPATGAVTCLHSNVSCFRRFSKKLFFVYLIGKRTFEFGERTFEMWKITPTSEVKSISLSSVECSWMIPLEDGRTVTTVNRAHSKLCESEIVYIHQDGFIDMHLKVVLYSFW